MGVVSHLRQHNPFTQTILSYFCFDKKMKLIYNKSGLSHKCYNEGLEHALTCIRYSSTKKIKILAAVKNIMEEEGLTEREVFAMFKIDYNLIP